jgi:hypothetical protein
MNLLAHLFPKKTEAGRCRICCHSRKAACSRPYQAHEMVRMEQVKQLLLVEKLSAEQAVVLLSQDHEWHTQAALNCVHKCCSTLKSQQGHKPEKIDQAIEKSIRRHRTKQGKQQRRHANLLTSGLLSRFSQPASARD